jgi:hypothetical protein
MPGEWYSVGGLLVGDDRHAAAEDLVVSGADRDHAVSVCLSCYPPFQAALSSKSLNGFCAAAAVLTLEDVLPDFVWEEVAGKSVLALDVP